jgi:leucyl aminopeptidase (aminopeptidase T)
VRTGSYSERLAHGRDDALVAAADLLLDRLAVTRGDTTLVVYTTENTSLARLIAGRASRRTQRVSTLAVTAGTRDGEEPPPRVAAAMFRASTVILLTIRSLSHTTARLRATRTGARIVSMPGISEELFANAIRVDYRRLEAAGRSLAQALTDADHCRISSPAGTDVQLLLRGRHGISDDGDFTQPGAFGNLPAGEAYIAPVETAAEGTIVLDGSLSGWGKLDRPVTITLRGGRAYRISGGEAAAWLARTLDDGGESGRVIAELGIGTNPGTRITGNMLGDEKMLGTIHFAFGTNTGMGGSNQSEVHIDGLVLDPQVELDGRSLRAGIDRYDPHGASAGRE